MIGIHHKPTSALMWARRRSQAPGDRRVSLLNCPSPSLASGRSAPTGSDIPVAPAGDDARMHYDPPATGLPGGVVSVVGSEAGMEARRVDADSSGARDGVSQRG